MEKSRNKYFNPFTDFGFKKIFGEELNKALLIDFLNELLRSEESTIVDLEYLTNEQLGYSPTVRRAVFDIHCRSQDGEQFIVEMQKTRQKYFKDRSVYYATFPIRSGGDAPGNWDFQLPRVYMVAVLDFVFNEDENDPDKFRYDVKLSDVDMNMVFYDKLTFIYLEMPKFSKGPGELESHFDKWLYALKNMPSLDEVPDSLQEEVFLQLFRTAEIAQFSEKEYQAYLDSLKVLRDNANTLDYTVEKAREEGLEEGREEGRIQEKRGSALKMIEEGIPLDTVSRITGLSAEELQRLNNPETG